MTQASPTEQLAPWITRLRELPMIRGVRALAGSSPGTDARIVVRLPAGETEYDTEVKRTASLGLPMIAQLAALRRQAPARRRILLAHHISTEMGKRLREIGVDYLDLAGNCHLEPRAGIYVHVEGQRLVDAHVGDARANLRGGGLHALFALAARPELAAAPVRQIAELAGAGKSTTAAVLKRLEDEGLLGSAGGQRRVLRAGQLRDRWVQAYAQTLRPRWIRGRFRPATDDNDDLERRVEAELDATTWAWGGTAAEMRMVKYYRGSETIVHVAKAAPDLPRRIRALPDRAGRLVVMVTPLPLAFEGTAAHVAHPLLVYAELLATADDRSHRAAEELRQRFLEPPA